MVDPNPTNTPTKEGPTMTPFEQWLDSGDAYDAAHNWTIPDDILLDIFTNHPDGHAAFRAWANDQIREGLGAA